MKPQNTPPPGMGPRGKKHEKPTPPPNKGLRFGSPLGYILLLVLGFMLFRNVFADAGVHRVSYSQFRTAVQEGQFSRVQISDDWVKGFLANAEVAPQPEEGERPGALRGTPMALPWMAYRVPGDERLIELLEAENVQYEAVPRSGFSEMLLIWLVPLGLVFLFWSLMMRRMAGGGMGQGPQSVMSFGKTRAKVQAEADTGVGFKDVAGVDEAVDELKEIVEFLKTPEKFRKLGGRIPKGVLLVGPPGTGKTLLARAVAGEAGVPFFNLSGSEFVEMFVGVGAARVRDLFAQATAKAPCIIFIDELDAIGKSRNSGMAGGHDEREQTLNQLLAEMDGFDSRAGLIILAATNRPEILDSALMRPGRFDRQVLVDRPDKRGRERVLEIHSRGVKLGPDVDLKSLASRTPGFAGADLANVVNEAALLAARRGRDKVMMNDLEAAKDKIMLGAERRSLVLSEAERRLTAYHEAGHAVVALRVPGLDPLHKVTIVPRGRALGITASLPEEDRHSYSRDFLLAQLVMLYGGRAAEEMVFGPEKITTGAGNDIERATGLARRMVAQFGMSEKVGPMSVGDAEHEVFLGRELVQRRTLSEETAKLVDDEVKRFLDEAYARAVETLQGNGDLLERLADALLERETLDREEIAALAEGRSLPELEQEELPVVAGGGEGGRPEPDAVGAGHKARRVQTDPLEADGT
jgi:cell division protease FtsH